MGSGVRHLAEANIAWMRYPLDDPRMAEFVDGLARINAEAESSPGFVWRLEGAEGDSTDIRAFDDPTILFNLSVWESPAALFGYTYRSGHADFFRRRAEWFAPAPRPTVALWWIDAGQRPTVEEARRRLDTLAFQGSSPYAFDFRTPFDAEGRQFPDGWRRTVTTLEVS